MSAISVQARGFKVDLRQTEAAAPEEVSKVLEAIKNGAQAIVEFCGRHKMIIRAAGLAVALTIGFGMEEAMAAPGMIGEAAQSVSFDDRLRHLYFKLVKFGKWAIIIKGGFETISKTMEGDWPAARKAGLSYALVYVILLGLPWIFDQVEHFFYDESIQTEAPIGGEY